MKHTFKIFAMVVIALVIVSCDQFCEQPTQTAVVLGFYTAADSAKGTRDGVAFTTFPADSTIVNLGTDTHAALCPLNPAADSCVFVLTKGEAENRISDTLTLVYERRPAFISEECGCVAFATLVAMRCSKNFIKSVELFNEKVGQVVYRPNVANAENIRIYY